MNFDRCWVVKEKEGETASTVSSERCPYYKKTSRVASYSLTGLCTAGAGTHSRFCTSKDIDQYCKDDYPLCPLYKAAEGKGMIDSLKEDAAVWPSF